MDDDVWPASGLASLGRDERGRLVATDGWLRAFLDWPELALVDESCADERRLHAAVLAAPRAAVPADALASIRDDDARRNWQLFLRFRDALVAAGSLEAWYVALFRSGRIEIPPVFVDRVAEAIVRGLVDDSDDAFRWRAAELLFREQRIALHEGRVLAGDRDALDAAQGSGRSLEVLAAANAHRYWDAGERRAFLLDLSHEIASDVGHGLRLTMVHRHSGQAALAWVLERWVARLLDLEVTIAPVARVDDAAWSWHVGLDAESMALLNALWHGSAASGTGDDRMVGLFRLEFADPGRVRADLAGKPVHLGLAATADGVVRLKPQNLVVNLPLA